MSSRIFNSLFEEKVDLFVQSFMNTSRLVFFEEKTNKLIHPGEFGTYREKTVKEFLRFIIPQSFDIGNGFVISSTDEVSTQCDIIVFDSAITPLIQSNELQTFFPVETVVGIGEIKSKMSKVELRNAINKLAKTKQIKSNVPNPNIHKGLNDIFNPKEVMYDCIFTFIVCEKFDFNLQNIETEIDSMYDEEVEYCHRHNLILSIEDGLLLYNLQKGSQNMVFYAPIFDGQIPNKFIKFDTEKKYHHFKTFAMALFDGISQATVLYPEIVQYMTGFTAINKFEE